MQDQKDMNGRYTRWQKIGWVLLTVAALAIAIPIAATAAQPHVLWLFTTSYGSVGLVVGTTLIRVGRRRRAPEARRPASNYRVVSSIAPCG